MRALAPGRAAASLDRAPAPAPVAKSGCNFGSSVLKYSAQHRARWRDSTEAPSAVDRCVGVGAASLP